MRVALLTANIYSERGLATLLELRNAGFDVVACVAIATTNRGNVIRKAQEMGPTGMARYAIRRFGFLRNRAESARTTSFSNPYLSHRIELVGMGVRHLGAACKRFGVPQHRTQSVNSDHTVAVLRQSVPDLII